MKDTNNTKRKLILTIISLLILITVVVGLSFAIFSYGDRSAFHAISTGSITVSYSEAEHGIYLSDAVPTEDNVGIMMRQERQYFDFAVSTNASGKIDIPYEINITEINVSQNMEKMSRNIIKIYLTKVLDNNEEVLVAPITIDNLKESQLRNGSLVLYSTIDKHDENSSRKFVNYRLRMWIDTDTQLSDIQGKEYKLLVNVDSKIQPLG